MPSRGMPRPNRLGREIGGRAGYDRGGRSEAGSGHPKRSSGKNAAAPTVAAENRATAIANARSLARKLITALAQVGSPILREKASRAGVNGG